MRYCKDCNWYRDDSILPQCVSPQNGISPETGRPSERWAKHNRDHNYYLGGKGCGPDGDFFEAAPPEPWTWWQRLLYRLVGP